MRSEVTKPGILHSMLSGFACASALFIVLFVTGFNKKVIAILAAMPLLAVLVLNIELATASSILFLFAEYNIYYYRVALFAFVPLIISFLFTYRNQIENRRKIANPILKPYLIYVIAIIPSFLNTTKPLLSLAMTFNWVSMSVMFFLLYSVIEDHEQMLKPMAVFLIMTALNGMDVILKGFRTGERVFGFMGVTFVDFVCIAFLLCFTILIYRRKTNPLPFFFLSIFFFISLFYTQTRSTMLALVFTIVVAFLLLYKYANEFEIEKKALVRLFTAILLSSMIIFSVASYIAPAAVARFSELFSGKTISIVNEDSFSQSSILTRLLIWLTALNAIVHHPFIGIGAYSFFIESQHYNVLPQALYELFIKDLSPHVTYLAVLTETGILGLTAFLVFLFGVLGMNIKSLNNSRTEKQRKISFSLLILQIYVLFSMCITDAWLWGQCAMLWSLILGFSLANYKIIFRTNMEKPAYRESGHV